MSRTASGPPPPPGGEPGAQRSDDKTPRQLELPSAEALFTQGDPRQQPTQSRVGGGRANDPVHERRVGEDAALDPDGVDQLLADLPPPARLVRGEPARRDIVVLRSEERRVGKECRSWRGAEA